MVVITPPHPIQSNPSPYGISMFLAGSIEMGVAEDWQTKVIDYFKGINDLRIYNPRREAWDSSWEQSITNPQFYQQVNWELNALEKSDMIILYLSPDTKSPISLLELGKFIDSGKLVVCCPKGFWRKGNVDIMCDRYGIPNFDNLDAMLEYVMRRF